MSSMNYDLALIYCLKCIMKQQDAMDQMCKLIKEPNLSGVATITAELDKAIFEAKAARKELFETIIPGESDG